jgi:hypothetical protein
MEKRAKSKSEETTLLAAKAKNEVEKALPDLPIKLQDDSTLEEILASLLRPCCRP